LKGGQAVAKILKAEGTDFMSHYPFVPITEELLDEGIRVIVTRHERTSISMADAYTRLSMGHKNGVAMCQLGWGAHNILGGLAEAYDDLSPMLMIPCGYSVNRMELRSWDSVYNFTPVTKWAAHMNSAARVPQLMRIAYTRLRTGRPGPVLLELMEEVLGGEIPDAQFNYEPVEGWKYQANPRDVEVAVRALLNAKAPLLYVGDGVLQADACGELKEFVDLVQAPVATSIKGKSAFPEDHPLSVGMRGRALWLCMGKSDLVFGIGTSLSGSFGSSVPPGKTIVLCNIGEYDLNLFHRTKYAVVGDAKLVLRQLIDEVKKQAGAEGRRRNKKLEEEIAQEKKLQFEKWRPKLESNDKPINPYRVIWDMMHTFDRKNTVITHESGNPREQLTAIWEALVPRSYLGWGYTTNLGFSWGAAMAAKLMWPKKLAVNWLGDAAMGHNAEEIETSLREKLPILSVVSNNSGYAVYTSGGKSSLRGIDLKVVTPSSVVSYAKFAESLGAYGERVEEPDEVVPALKRAMKQISSGRPAMVEVITSKETERISGPIPADYQPGKP
jgi:acetolactate synthase-1/2/3 large subunit